VQHECLRRKDSSPEGPLMAREAKKASRFNWQLWAGIGGLAVACVSSAWAGLKVRQYALSDPQFTFSRNTPDVLTIEGLKYTSKYKVRRVFAADYDRSIFAIGLAERRRRLLAIDWVEAASVSRIWPDRLLVRIRERKPVAFVFFRSGVLLIDAHGVLLDPPAQAQFTFPVLSGIRESESEAQRAERVRAFQRVLQDMGYLSKDVSEVDVTDPENIRIVAQVEKTAIELIMGDGNFAARYQNFLTHFPEIRKRFPAARVFDLRLGDRITAKSKDQG
jgi:cell division protein FtsQ